MKLLRVDFHNFRSACDALTRCSLEVEPDITCLIGTSESGKSNLLEAMAKFESGEFNFDDVPRRLITGTSVIPQDDLLVVSASYGLEDADIRRLKDSGTTRNNPITINRHYTGPLISETATERSLAQFANNVMQATESFEDVVSRFLRAYNRRRNLHPGARETRSTTLWLHKFLDSVADHAFGSSQEQVTELAQLFTRFSISLQRLDPRVTERVIERTRAPAFDAVRAMQGHIEQLASAARDSMGDVLDFRPKFRLISSDPSEWLQGEYPPSSLLSDVQGVTSASLLLELAGLDFAKLQDAPDTLIPDLLDEASTTASGRLNRYWSQDDIGIRFQLARSGNLIIYVATDDHRGLPTQRSMGFRWYLEFMLTYAHARESGEPTVLLFDEPGIHLHPSAQEDLKRLLKGEISRHMQVIYTTHLPGMVDTSRLDAIRGVVKNDTRSRGTWVINEEYSPEHNQITWDVMLKAIGAHGPEGYDPGRTVILEGLSDKQYLVGVAKSLAGEGETRSAEISTGIVRLLPGYGTRSLIPITQRMIRNHSSFVVLLDKDSAGDQAKVSLQSKYNPPNEWFLKIIQVTDPDYGEYFSESTEYALEDLFGVDLYSAMVNQIFAAHAQECGPFNPPTDPPQPMLKKAAEEWLESTGQDPDLIYMVANQFSDMLSAGQISLPPEVKDRFAVLLEYIAQSTVSS